MTTQRHSNALSIHDGVPSECGAQNLARFIAQAQTEIFNEKKGSDDVLKDPAVCLLMGALSVAMNVKAINTGIHEYGEMTQLVEDEIARFSLKSKAQNGLTNPVGTLGTASAADRRWVDAQSAQGGAVNVGAMANSMVRHAAQMQVDFDPTGKGSADEFETHLKKDVALRLITHQMESLFRAPLYEKDFQDQCVRQCQAVVALNLDQALDGEAAKKPKSAIPSP